MKRRDPRLNMGCANCEHYAGAYPANVPNFRCNAEIPKFKVYFCTKFEKLRSETLEKN